MKQQKLIRVTSVLSFVDSEWYKYWLRGLHKKGSKNPYLEAKQISDESTSFGTSVHNLVEASLRNEIIELDSKEQALCAEAILDYLTKHNITPLLGNYQDSMEIEIKDKKLGLIGHFDYAALVDGQPCIIDFKTSNQMRKSFPLQKAAYAKMANKQFGLNIDRGLTIRSHWNKELNKVEFEDKSYPNLIKRYWPAFNNCLNVYKYFNRADK